MGLILDFDNFVEALVKIGQTLVNSENLDARLEELCSSETFKTFVFSCTKIPFEVDSEVVRLPKASRLDALPVLRKIRTRFSQPIKFLAADMAELAHIFSLPERSVFEKFSEELSSAQAGSNRLSEVLQSGIFREEVVRYRNHLEKTNPHALYPTSLYRESSGSVWSSPDDCVVEAEMSCKTFTSIRIEEGILNSDNKILKNVYKPLGRCICLVDSNVEEHFGEKVEAYFGSHEIELEKLTYRAMEVDKVLSTVESILDDFKTHAVARHEPVLIIGGGVLADVGGLACALFNRNTPYIMIGSSIVSAIDAGPSPRTCCDGYGYKNLSGSYHAPVLTLTDRSFFGTLHLGWLRHGVAEIIKMAIVKDYELFKQLEVAGPALFKTRFGTTDASRGTEIDSLAQKILAGAMRSYVEAEYDNLYETHQCRPHAYGHTWSPGFELQAGLLHGHAVSIGMGLGAFLSFRKGWLEERMLKRILHLISKYELSLWNDILLDEKLIWAAQKSVIDKRGGNLVAPVPKGKIGVCGYINELSREELASSIQDYREVCVAYDRNGEGIEPLCVDVGLEEPSEASKLATPTVAA